jgi:hypothetical protein
VLLSQDVSLRACTVTLSASRPSVLNKHQFNSHQKPALKARARTCAARACAPFVAAALHAGRAGWAMLGTRVVGTLIMQKPPAVPQSEGSNKISCAVRACAPFVAGRGAAARATSSTAERQRGGKSSPSYHRRLAAGEARDVHHQRQHGAVRAGSEGIVRTGWPNCVTGTRP